MKPRLLAWFSCGAASAVAAKESIRLYGETHDVMIVNCDTRPSEHPDNYRFSAECEKWFGQPITYIRNEDYQTVDEVFKKTRYMSGVIGARCTTELKKIPRLRFSSPDDLHVFGFTADEHDRIRDFELRNPDMLLRWPLLEQRITKSACYYRIQQAGIELPFMYGLGFNNNNCPGCVKAQSLWYWDMIRTHFPDVFKRRCEQSREIGARLIRLNGERAFLDELPAGPFKSTKENISCGPECGQLSLGI